MRLTAILEAVLLYSWICVPIYYPTGVYADRLGCLQDKIVWAAVDPAASQWAWGCGSKRAGRKLPVY